MREQKLRVRPAALIRSCRMRNVKLVCLAVASAVSLMLGATAANAVSLSCPSSIGGATGYNAQYTLSGAASCAFGTGQLNANSNDAATITGYVNSASYPNPPSPNTGVYPIAGGYSSWLESVNPGTSGTYLS